MTAADVYRTLGVDPLPEPGRAWLALGLGDRYTALARVQLPHRYAPQSWRALPKYVKKRMSDAFESRRSN